MTDYPYRISADTRRDGCMIDDSDDAQTLRQAVEVARGLAETYSSNPDAYITISRGSRLVDQRGASQWVNDEPVWWHTTVGEFRADCAAITGDIEGVDGEILDDAAEITVDPLGEEYCVGHDTANATWMPLT